MKKQYIVYDKNTGTINSRISVSNTNQLNSFVNNTTDVIEVSESVEDLTSIIVDPVSKRIVNKPDQVSQRTSEPPDLDSKNKIKWMLNSQIMNLAQQDVDNWVEVNVKTVADVRGVLKELIKIVINNNT